MILLSARFLRCSKKVFQIFVVVLVCHDVTRLRNAGGAWWDADDNFPDFHLAVSSSSNARDHALLLRIQHFLTSRIVIVVLTANILTSLAK